MRTPLALLAHVVAASALGAAVPQSAIAEPSPDPVPSAETPSALPLDRADPRLVTFSIGLSHAWPGGEVKEGTPMNDLTSSMPGFELEAGVRIAPKWLIGLRGSLHAGGTPGEGVRARCKLDGIDCAVVTAEVGLQGRYVFTPSDRKTWWAGVGLGGEVALTTADGKEPDRDYLATYRGGGLRLSAGWDRRVNRTFGWGLFGALAFGPYRSVSHGAADDQAKISDDAVHSWLGLGARLILFP